eukprot:contig_26903_g6612
MNPSSERHKTNRWSTLGTQVQPCPAADNKKEKTPEDTIDGPNRGYRRYQKRRRSQGHPETGAASMVPPPPPPLASST